MCELQLSALFTAFTECKDFLLELDGAPDNGNQDWILNCKISGSALGDNLVLATPRRLVMVATKCHIMNSKESTMGLKVVCKWAATDCSSISCVACVPVSAAPGGPSASADWVCIVVGFSSGHLRFYTEGMKLLIEEKLNDEEVRQIHFIQSEIITIVYPSVMCNLNGFSLWQSLRGARAQLARNVIPVVEPLEVKKYGFTDQESMEDACFLGVPNINAFDHLATVSISSGFHCNYRSSPSACNLILACGRRPFIGFYYTNDTAIQPVLTDVALTMVSKLTNTVSNVVPSWLSLGGSRSSTKTNVNPPALPTPLTCRYGLCDARRVGRKLTLSSDGSLAAVADSLARVMLIDTTSGIAIRLWKGMRDAEVAFIESYEKKEGRSRNKSSSPRKTVFIAIYSPKKGMIEIFSLKQGKRVANFSVGSGHLLATFPVFLGSIQKARFETLSSVFFLNENGLVNIVVPFHSALINETDSRAKDNRILSQLKSLVRGKIDGNWEDLINLTGKLETNFTKKIVLKTISTSTFANIQGLRRLINSFRENSEKESQNIDDLFNFCNNLEGLLKFYDTLQNLNSITNEDANEKTPRLSEILHIDPVEAEYLEKLIEKKMSCENLNKVKFTEEQGAELSAFLSSFDYTELNVVSDDKLYTIGIIIFNNVFDGCREKIEKWKEGAILSKMKPLLLAKTLFVYWQHQRLSDNFSCSVQSLIKLIQAIVELADKTEERPSDLNTLSPWWSHMRTFLTHSEQITHALIASLCCRACVLLTEQELSQEFGFEQVSREVCAWDLLIVQLEDATLLLSDDSTEGEGMRSLSALAQRGPGAPAEIVARWCLKFDIEPELIIDQSDIEFQNIRKSPERKRDRDRGKGDYLTSPVFEVEFRQPTDLQPFIRDRLNKLKYRFPYSLTSSALMANIVWELLLNWQSDIAKGPYLESAIRWLKAIPHIKIKHGLSLMVWSTYLKTHVESAFRLISVMGKVPADKLCVQEIGLTAPQIGLLFSATVDLFNLLLDTLSSQEDPFLAFPLETESLWMELCVPNAPPSLASVACNQPQANGDLLWAHLQLFNCCLIIAKLDVKTSRKLISYLSSEASGLFTQLTTPSRAHHSHPHVSPKPIRDAQHAFLLRAVASAADHVMVTEAAAGDTMADPTAAVRWFRITIDIANTWQLPVDGLRKCYIYELYSGGYDRIAEELLNTVADAGGLAAELLRVVGMRVKVEVGRYGEADRFSCFNRTLSSWIEELDEGALKQPHNQASDTEVLLTWVLQHLPETHPDYTLALLLTETLPSILSSP